MDELIIRSLRGATNDMEERRLAEWRAASPANERHFQDVSRVWELGEVLQEEPGQEAAPTIHELLQRADRSTPPIRSRLHLPRIRFPRVRRAFQAAAVILLTFTVGRASVGKQRGPALGAAEFVTGPAEMVTVTLGDGSVVRLAPESRLRLTGADEREVWLDGHAYFAVTKREGAFFRVRTHAGNARVLGTRFDLQAREGKLRLLVVEGNVELTARGETVELGASELGQVENAGSLEQEKMDPDSVRDELRWMGDFLVFEATPLGQVARELSLHYGVPIEVLDSTLAMETVHGWFAKEELHDVLQIVCRAVNAHCSVLPSGITIEP